MLRIIGGSFSRARWCLAEVKELGLGFRVSDLAGLMERRGGQGEDDRIEMDT